MKIIPDKKLTHVSAGAAAGGGGGGEKEMKKKTNDNGNKQDVCWKFLEYYLWSPKWKVYYAIDNRKRNAFLFIVVTNEDFHFFKNRWENRPGPARSGAASFEPFHNGGFT